MDNNLYEKKYIKYKTKYNNLKNQEGGGKLTLLLFNAASSPELMEAIKKYETIISENNVDVLLDKKNKFREISIPFDKKNGNPSLFKYTIGDANVKSIFDSKIKIKSSILSDKVNKEKTIKLNKEIKATIEKFIKLSSVDLSKTLIAGKHTWQEYANTSFNDNMEIVNNKLINHINAENKSKNSEKIAVYNSLMKIAKEEAISPDDEFFPICFKNSLGFESIAPADSTQPITVGKFLPIDTVIFVSDLKHEFVSSLLGGDKPPFSFTIKSVFKHLVGQHDDEKSILSS